MKRFKQIETVFRVYERNVKSAVYKVYKQKTDDKSRTSFIHQASTLLSEVVDLDLIHPNLKDSGIFTKAVKTFTFVVYILRCALPLKNLRALCIMPPRGCPLERWVCFFGPCRSSNTWKCQKLDTVKHFRSIVGHEDDFPENYYEGFEEFWGNFKRKSGAIGLNNPLMLFPVRDLEPVVRDTIVKENPILAEIADNLFVCVDHFKNSDPSERVVDKRALSSFSIDNLNYQLRQKNVQFKISSQLSSRKAYVEKLTDGYMLDIKMTTNLIGTILDLSGVCDTVGKALEQMHTAQEEMSQRYEDGAFQSGCFNQMQFDQRSQHSEQTHSGFQSHE